MSTATVIATVSFIIVVAVAKISNAADYGQSKGALKIGKEAIELKYAYAHLYENEEGLGGGRKELRVLLSDREIQADILTKFNGMFLIQGLAREGKLRGAYFRLDPADTQKNAPGILLYNSGGNARASFVPLGAAGADNFKGLKVEKAKISGEVAYDSAKNNQFDDIAPFTINSKFEAPLKAAEPAKKLVGKAALESPHVKAVIAYATASKKGDLSALKGLVSKSRFAELEKLRAEAGEKEFKAMAADMGPPVEAISKNLKIVVVRSSSAVVVISDGEGGTMAMPLILSDGAWKIE